MEANEAISSGTIWSKKVPGHRQSSHSPSPLELAVENFSQVTNSYSTFLSFPGGTFLTTNVEIKHGNSKSHSQM